MLSHIQPSAPSSQEVMRSDDDESVLTQPTLTTKPLFDLSGTVKRLFKAKAKEALLRSIRPQDW